MLGLQELKPKIETTATNVDCPIKGCIEKVKRQSHSFRRDERFKCPKHNIYISPSTFEYEKATDNLLWKEKADLSLLEKIMKVKRESRMARDNSEDAVTWNVFRYLEKNSLIEGFLSQLIGTTQENTEVIYWSYSQKEGKGWILLDKARAEFGEEITRGSEPDIIVKTDKTLFFIEAKLTSGNETTPSDKNNFKKYETGGKNLFKEVFISDYRTIAIIERKYELMRFWLLGTWMAEKIEKEFYLINLVREGEEEGIEAIFKKHIKETQRRKFKRITWEIICEFISKHASPNSKPIIFEYFKNKTVGYEQGRLKKAFSI